MGLDFVERGQRAYSAVDFGAIGATKCSVFFIVGGGRGSEGGQRASGQNDEDEGCETHLGIIL